MTKLKTLFYDTIMNIKQIPDTQNRKQKVQVYAKLQQGISDLIIIKQTKLGQRAMGWVHFSGTYRLLSAEGWKGEWYSFGKNL